MLKKYYTKTAQFASVVMTYCLIGFSVAIISYVFTKEVLLKLQSIPERQRRDYDDSFLSFLALTFFYLGVGLVLYGIIITLIPKLSSSMFLKVFVAILASIFPLVCIRLMTFGMGLSDPGMLAEFLRIAIGGGLLPIVQKLTIGFFSEKIL